MFTSTRSKLTSTILAGTLALGMVPMVAFADDEPDVVDDPAVEVVTTDSEEVEDTVEPEAAVVETLSTESAISTLAAPREADAAVKIVDSGVYPNPATFVENNPDAEGSMGNMEALGDVPVFYVIFNGTAPEGINYLIETEYNGTTYGCFCPGSWFTGENQMVYWTLTTAGGNCKYIKDGDSWVYNENGAGFTTPTFTDNSAATVSVVSTTATKGETITSADITGTIMEPVTYTVNDTPTVPLPPMDQLNPIFWDVLPGSWYYDAVETAAKNGWVHGYGLGKFGPNDLASRAQIAVMLYNVDGYPVFTDPTFTDVTVKDYSWAWDAIAWAQNKGVVHGYSDTTFGPGDSATREQFAVMLCNLAGGSSFNVDSAYSYLKKNNYPDVNEVDTWALPAMAWAVQEGVISGVAAEDGTYLAPLSNITRAEIATMLVRRFG